MKNNYSIAERNRIVEEHLWCIDRVIRKNRSLMRAARLDYDDVYPFGVILPQPASLVTAGWEACGTTWESCEPNVAVLPG